MEEDFARVHLDALDQIAAQTRAMSLAQLQEQKDLIVDLVDMAGRSVVVATAKSNLPSGDLAVLIAAQAMVFPSTPEPAFAAFQVDTSGRITEGLDEMLVQKLKQMAVEVLPDALLRKLSK